MRKVTAAVTQMACSEDIPDNIARGEDLVRQAASRGAQIILLQELFETKYFCQVEDEIFFRYAKKAGENPAIKHFQSLARELQVVLPISFFEREKDSFYNSVAIIDVGGELLGIYRKTHIPDGPGYQEKFYFRPGDTGFKVWSTRYGRIGVGICWDQWFPEAARSMVLMGAELLLYPTAIGSEPGISEIDSKNHWQLCMQGHAAANIVPVIASNRIGREVFGPSEIIFYGSSFITNHTGEKVAEADRTSPMVLTAEFDLDEISSYRQYWGVFKDRRPDMYGSIVDRCDRKDI